MSVAILGWGSLCWNPGELVTVGPWQADGPMLPIEFARISRADRLSLCLFPAADPVMTYWIRSGASDLEAARETLRSRENCVTAADIGCLAREGAAQFRPLPGMATNVKAWLETHADIDAVIWTDLRSNFEAKTGGTSFTVENAINWLQDLVNANRHQRAEEYIRKAPPQTETRLRARARELFGWINIECGLAAGGAA